MYRKNIKERKKHKVYIAQSYIPFRMIKMSKTINKFENRFKTNVRNLWAIADTRIKIGNGIYGELIETLIKGSSLYPKIKEMRRDKTVDRKKTAALIKKAYTELGYSEVQIEKEFNAYKKEYPEYVAMVKIEKEGEKMLKRQLEQMPLYTGFLSKVKGLGVKTSAKLLALTGNMTRFDKPSSLTHYAGLHCVEIVKSGQTLMLAPKASKGIEMDWNPKLKALLLGVIGENMLKQNSQYRRIYDERTARTKVTHPEWWHLNADGTKSTAKNMHPKHGYRDGIRVMMKRFLNEYWKAGYLAQKLEPPTKPYILNFPEHNEEPDIVSFTLCEPQTLNT
jgi:hypothetical protein